MKSRKASYSNSQFFVWMFLCFTPICWGAPYVARLEATPDSFSVQQQTVVKFTVQVDNGDPSLIANSAQLVRYNQQKQVVGRPSQLFDDGTHGDAVSGDGLFSGELIINEPNPTLMYFKASFAYKGLLKRVMSDFVALYAEPELSQQDADIAASLPNQAYNQYQIGMSNGLTHLAAQNETIAWLLQQPEVAEAGVTDDDDVNIYIIFKSGILGAVILSPPGTKGGGISISNYSGAPLNVVDKANAIAIKTAEIGDDETISVPPLLLQNQVPIKTQSYGPSQSDVNVFKTLSNYGAVIISAHGGTAKATDGSIKEFFLTGEKYDPKNFQQHEVDLRRHRLMHASIDGTSYYGVLPDFIKEYNKDFPNSIIYVSSCRSARNKTMSKAFLDAGAKTYFGYTENVDANYATIRGTQLFKDLTKIDDFTGLVKTTGEAYNCLFCSNIDLDLISGIKLLFGIKPASFAIVGDDNTVLPNDLIANGSFETGGLKFWNIVGNYAAAVPTNATDGAFSARIGRVDGPSVGTNSIYQDIEIPTVNMDNLPPGAKLNIWFNYTIKYKRDKSNDAQDEGTPSSFLAYLAVASVDPFPVPGPIATDSDFEGVANEIIRNDDVSLASAFNTLSGVADVTRFMGNTIRLSFSLLHGGDPYERVTAYIDDVFFDVCSDLPDSGLEKCGSSNVPIY